MAEHLQFFNAVEAEGRVTGSAGFSRVAAYVAARMREFGLQPVLEGEYRLLYQTPVNFPTSTVLAGIGGDTLLFQPGMDYLPDGRTDSGRVQIDEVLRLPARMLDEPLTQMLPPAVLVGSAAISRPQLVALRDAGVRVVLLPGPLRPGASVAPVEGVVILQLSRTALEALAEGLSTPDVADSARVALSYQLRGRVVTRFHERTGALNIMGYVAGKHPTLAHELVIVCADLDAAGHVAGVRTIDLDHLGARSAALLELARNYGYFARLLSVPERTVLFALWSGGRLGHAGLREYLDKPTWTLDATVEVVYLGLDAEEEPEVRALLAPHDIPLRVVPFEAAPDDQPSYLFVTDSAPRRDSRRRAVSRPPSLRLSEVLADAVTRGQRLADAAHEALISIAITPAPFAPIREATIPVPNDIDTP